jgi:hypothetical protein
MMRRGERRRWSRWRKASTGSMVERRTAKKDPDQRIRDRLVKRNVKEAGGPSWET